MNTWYWKTSKTIALCHSRQDRKSTSVLNYVFQLIHHLHTRQCCIQTDNFDNYCKTHWDFYVFWTWVEISFPFAERTDLRTVKSLRFRWSKPDPNGRSQTLLYSICWTEGGGQIPVSEHPTKVLLGPSVRCHNLCVVGTGANKTPLLKDPCNLMFYKTRPLTTRDWTRRSITKRFSLEELFRLICTERRNSGPHFRTFADSGNFTLDSHLIVYLNALPRVENIHQASDAILDNAFDNCIQYIDASISIVWSVALSQPNLCKLHFRFLLPTLSFTGEKNPGGSSQTFCERAGLGRAVTFTSMPPDSPVCARMQTPSGCCRSPVFMSPLPCQNNFLCCSE